jgi:F-type H+-transporting ATPase subunit alpha
VAQDLTISSQDIAAALRRYVDTFEPSMEREQVGRVTATGDGVAVVEGLPGAMANELLEFPNGVLGIAFNLDEDSIGCIVLGAAEQIEEGDSVKQTGRILSVGVGDVVLGRVIDPIGVALDGKGSINYEEFRALEIQAPTVVERQPVKEPLQTGIKAIDAMTGRPERPPSPSTRSSTSGTTGRPGTPRSRSSASTWPSDRNRRRWRRLSAPWRRTGPWTIRSW